MAIQEILILPWQAEFLICDRDIAAVIGGFASGKSFICAHWLLNRCLQYPAGTHVIVAKDLPQAKRGPIATLRGVMESRNVDYAYNASTGEITLNNGCRIKALSVQNYLAFRALEADSIWADEAADWGPSAEIAFTRYLAPRLRPSPGGKKYLKHGMKPQMRISSNPSALGSWLHELIVKKNYCKCWNVSLRDNHLMPELDTYIDRQERSLSPDLWPFLIDGNWGSTTTGTVYKGFNRQLAIQDPTQFGLPPMARDLRKPLLWSLDFNVGLMCSVVLQSHPQQRIVDRKAFQDLRGLPVTPLAESSRLAVDGFQHNLMYVIDELRIPNSGTPDVLDEFLLRYGDHARQAGVILYGDASGGGKAQQISAQSAARSNWAILVQGLQREGIKVQFRVPKANPSVLDRVNETKAQIKTKDGRGLFIDEAKAPYLLTDLESVRWKEGTNDIDKDDDKMTHLSDALGYVLWVERTLAKRQAIDWRTNLE